MFVLLIVACTRFARQQLGQNRVAANDRRRIEIEDIKSKVKLEILEISVLHSSRQGRPTIAHPFRGGLGKSTNRQVPLGTKDVLNITRKHEEICRPDGTSNWRGAWLPPINRWAIIGRPRGTKSVPQFINPFGKMYRGVICWDLGSDSH